MAIPTLDKDVPVHWMPVAVLLGYAVLYLGGRVALHHLAVSVFFGGGGSRTTNANNANANTNTSVNALKTPYSTRYTILGFIALSSYCIVVGRVSGSIQKAVHASFDPYVILDLGTKAQPTVNLTKELVTSHYKDKVRMYHPSNPATGNAAKLQDVMDAFQTFTDEHAQRRWKHTGHPHGPLLTPIFLLSVPAWVSPFPPQPIKSPDPLLLFPSMLSFIRAAHALALTAILYRVYQEYREHNVSKKDKGSSKNGDEEKEEEDLDWNLESNTVHELDVQYLIEQVKPDLTHDELLILVLSCPTNLVWGRRNVETIETQRLQRIEKLNRPQHFNYASLVDEGGWAEDDDEENDDHTDHDSDNDEREGRNGKNNAVAQGRRRREKEAEEEQRKQQAAQQGIKMEGVDDGVLGQVWVEETLQSAGAWPPRVMGCLHGQVFEWNNTQLPPLEHPVIRRMLCMLTGRLHAQLLNAHPALLNAGIHQRVDQTYFQSTMVFRHRMSLLLDAVLKIATAFHSRRLLCTAIETATLFKIGTKCGAEEWFRDAMIKQYGIQPQLNVSTFALHTPGHQKKSSSTSASEILAGRDTQVMFEMVRLHAENFLRQKLQQLQQQGIPPQMGLQAYREGWWFLVSCEQQRLDKEEDESSGRNAVYTPAPVSRDAFQKTMKMNNVLSVPSDAQLALFNQEKSEHRLLVTVPMILGNISQKSIRAQGSIQAPAVPGKYRCTLEIKSLEFLGADVSRTIDVDIVQDNTTTAATAAAGNLSNIEEPKKEK